MPKGATIDFNSTRPPSPFLKDTHVAWRRELRRFIDREIMPFVEEWEEAEEIPLSLYKKASDFGLLRMGYPEEFGGISEGLDRFHGIVTSEELARIGAGGVTASLMVHGIGLPPILALGPEEMKRKIAPAVLAGDKRISLAITEPSGGSDVAQIKTRARRVGDEFIVDGSKMFITGGMRADYFTTAVRTGGEGMGGLSLLLDRSGQARRFAYETEEAGLVGVGYGGALFQFRACAGRRILIGGENLGFTGIVNNFNGERLGMAAGACASARVCLEEAAAWAQQRETFGKRLADHQVIRHKIAEMLRQINATTAYLDMCAWRVTNGERPAADLALLKVQATLTLEFCAREAMQILGGSGYMRGGRVERIYREVRVNAIGGGSEEILRDLAARQIGL